ncbi:hypothetical protein QFZ30_002956 [Arthrobacter pascens]|nr:hypothetical protein [Arthrobacter pascens]
MPGPHREPGIPLLMATGFTGDYDAGYARAREVQCLVAHRLRRGERLVAVDVCRFQPTSVGKSHAVQSGAAVPLSCAWVSASALWCSKEANSLSRDHNTTILVVTHDRALANKTERRFRLQQGKLTEEPVRARTAVAAWA